MKEELHQGDILKIEHIKTEDVEGYVQCEKMALLDLNIRGYSKIDRIHYPDIINITDAIQGIFDYI